MLNVKKKRNLINEFVPSDHISVVNDNCSISCNSDWILALTRSKTFCKLASDSKAHLLIDAMDCCS